jgi:hypothetical protein
LLDLQNFCFHIFVTLLLLVLFNFHFTTASCYKHLQHPNKKGKELFLYSAPFTLAHWDTLVLRALRYGSRVSGITQCHPHTFIRNGMSRTWEFTSAIFNQQSPTDLLVATNLPTSGWMTGLVGLRLVFHGQSHIQVLTAPSAAYA